MSALDIASLVWCVLAISIFATLTRTAAPYGRHEREGWGVRIPALAGWVTMEAVSFGIIGACAWRALATAHDDARASFVLAALWLVHYAHRSFIYPLRTRRVGQTMPLSIAVMAIAFNSVNASTNGIALFWAHPRDAAWFFDARFIVGVAIFVIGAGINMWSDNTLIRLRRSAPAMRYQVPRGGLFELVSCPNYLGEVIEWIGFAIAAWSLPALSFAVWTFANLVPRARSHHRWYREQFPDYPPQRRAIFPWLV